MNTLAFGLALSVSSALAANIDVTVGKGGLVFDPPSIKAAVGDTVTYKFFPKVRFLSQVTCTRTDRLEPCCGSVNV